MGGFWPSAATALANRAAGECGSAGGMEREAVLLVSGDNATVLQAWQAAQDSQCPVASGATALETRANASARLWVANPDNDTVAVIDTATRIARGEITVLENDDTRFGVKLIEVMATKTS